MKRLGLAMLVVLGLVLALTPLMSAYAEVQLPAYIRFKSYAFGACFLLHSSKPLYLPPDWYGDASGNIALIGCAKATSYEGSAYSTAPGDIYVAGSIAVRWFENRELHLLSIAIYSKPTSQGIFWPEIDGFAAGIPSEPAPGWEEPLLSFKGIYKAGSNFQRISGSIHVGAGPFTGTEIIMVFLWFGDYQMQMGWVRESIQVPASWDPSLFITIPAGTMLAHEVKLL